jgi:hypothetical protein
VARWLGYSHAENMCDRDLETYGNKLESNFVRSFVDWSYLPKQELILIQAPKKIVRLESTPLLGRIVSLLSDKPYSLSDLFEIVWGLNYKKDLHHKHIHSILSKLRKKLPLNALAVKNGSAGLK